MDMDRGFFQMRFDSEEEGTLAAVDQFFGGGFGLFGLQIS